MSIVGFMDADVISRESQAYFVGFDPRRRLFFCRT